MRRPQGTPEYSLVWVDRNKGEEEEEEEEEAVVPIMYRICSRPRCRLAEFIVPEAFLIPPS
jgi:hypothetical protein